MRPAWREEDRGAAVRSAVRGWHAAGLVDAAVVEAAGTQWPPRGPAVGPLWRVLIAIFTAAGAAALAAGLGAVSGIRHATEAALFFAVLGTALAAATEVLLERFRFAPTGAEAATSALALLFLGIAVGIGAHEALGREVETRLTLGAISLLLTAAAWRWGFRVYAAAAACALLLLLASLPAPRAMWLAGAAVATLATTRALRRRDLVPSHRDGIELVRAVALAALYVAANYASVDHGLLEGLRLRGARLPAPEGPAAMLAALAATALLPPALLAWGVRARHRGLIALAVLAAAASIVTIRLYHHIAPLWAVLAAGGAALAGGSLLIERWLKTGREGERGGFTAAPLYHEGRRERLLPLAAALAAAPGPRELPPEPRAGGGSFGGGGAGGAF